MLSLHQSFLHRKRKEYTQHYLREVSDIAVYKEFSHLYISSRDAQVQGIRNSHVGYTYKGICSNISEHDN